MTSRRKQYTAAFKLQVIKAAEETNNCAAAREFSVNEKLVRDWRKVSHKLNMPKRKWDDTNEDAADDVQPQPMESDDEMDE